MNENGKRPERQPAIKIPLEKISPSSSKLQSEVLKASAQTADALFAGDKSVAKKGMDALIMSVSKDFHDHDAPLPPKVESSLRSKVKKAINESGKTIVERVFSPEMQKDLADYRNLVSNIESTYAFPVNAPEFYKAANKVRLNSLLETLSLYGIQHASNPGHLNRIFREVGKMQTNTNRLDQLKSVMTIGRETLPYVYILGLIQPFATANTVNKQFEDSMLKLRSGVNARVAQSVFMRDFEFIHDKPASEILNVVEKGKHATVDLMKITYKQMIPKIASLGAISTTEFLIAPPAGIMSLMRIPLLARHGEMAARTILKDRAENLKRKDLIDARILSSLQSLEVVRTTDSMVNAMQELQSNMEKSDQVDVMSDKSQSDRDITESRIGLAYTFGIPVVAAGWEALMNRKSLFGSNVAMNSGEAQVGVLLAGTSTFALEGLNSVLIEELVHDYTDKIQPAIQDIRRMDELLGPYDKVDTPGGPKELARKPVEQLRDFDISIQNMQFKNILHDVTMDIPQGSFITIKGPSGIGKTTFLRHMLGLFESANGVIQYGGTDLSSIKKYGEHSIYSKLAYANQNPQYFENMSLRENLLLWTSKKVGDDRLKQVLHDLRLDHIADRMDSNVKHFSGGELRRIGIARALLKDPKVLFLDEPTANLDEESARQVLEIIKDIRVKRPDMTVVAVTHDANFEKIAEKIVDFAEVNKPKDVHADSLGDRQVFYANAKVN